MKVKIVEWPNSVWCLWEDLDEHSHKNNDYQIKEIKYKEYLEKIGYFDNLEDHLDRYHSPS